ncbi:site-specific integrase [Adhaeribacter aquaticus]|uniref:site-specific integrase n=1 Tax=Adhaeribacter aquaticus TaxID=299567 RepID=UPI00041CB441|nr:site-specific integrase [Adhaeribacter aquaticus]
MGVELRKKKLASGKISLYLDIYHNGKRNYDFLKLYLLKANSTLDRQQNKETLKMAESLRSKREIYINSLEHGFEPGFKKKINFIDYFESFLNTYKNKDIRLVKSCLKYFKDFVGKDYLYPYEVTAQLCIDFKSYLESRLNGETPANYFAKFKKLLKQANRDKILAFNPGVEIQNKKNEGVIKDILSTDEIQTLANTYCGNTEVKRAFLFACCTGLRYCDIRDLRWSNIYNGTLKIKQLKTNKPVSINLNSTSLKLLGDRGKPEESIFKLPSHTGLSKSLKAWTKKAEIEKHITFHVARHSFATNLVIYETDISTVSSLLGHTSFKHTQKYVRAVEALKEQAVNRLPEIDF